MNRYHLVITIICFSGILLLAQDEDKKPRKRYESKQGWSELSESEREKVRAALKDVWTDSKVLSARANVTQSVDEYKTAVREAIANQDPETAKLLEKIQHQGLLNANGEGPKRGMMNPQRPFEQIRSFPHIAEKLDDDDREKFKQTSTQVRDLPEVVSSWEDLRQLRKENEGINRRQHEAIRKFRRVYLEKIVELAPELESKIDIDQVTQPKGGKGGKGKGKKGKRQSK